METSNHEGCQCPKCNQPIYLIDLTSLLQPDELKPLFLKQKDSFLSRNPHQYKQCPTPDCGNILCNPSETGTKPVEMVENIATDHIVFCDNCGQDYCFLCLKTHIDEDCTNPGKPKEKHNTKTQQSKQEIFERSGREPNEHDERKSVSFAQLLEDDVSNSRAVPVVQGDLPSLSVSHSREPVRVVHVCPGCRFRCSAQPQSNLGLVCQACKISFCTVCYHNFTKQAEQKDIYSHAVKFHHDKMFLPQSNRRSTSPEESIDDYFER